MLNGIVYIYFIVRKTDSSLFTLSRTTIGTVTVGLRPLETNQHIPVAASSTGEGVLDRTANVVISTDGTMFLDMVQSSFTKVRGSISYPVSLL